MSAPSGFPTGGGELGALMREKDWSATPLGDPEGWPRSLRTAVDLCLASRFPLFLWWGPELVNIYNDAYVAALGDKHPRALGESARSVWSEIWDVVGPLADGVMTRGEATWAEDQQLLLMRSGYLEECYFDFAYSPVTDESGGVRGLFGVVSETTGRVLGTRRLQTLGEIASRTHGVEGPARVLEQCVAALDADRRDLPFALLYEDTGEARRLVAATGLTDAEARRLGGGAGGWDPLQAADGARDPAGHRRAFPLRELTSLALRPDPDRPGCDEAFVVPVGEGGDGGPGLWLVCGISEHRALDDALRQFCRLAARAIGSALADARAFDDERARAEALAELDRAKTAFFANVSHELRTPLTLMLGPLEDAVSGRDPDPDLEMVHRNALRLLRHVDSLLEFSRLQGDRVRADRRPVDLAAAAGELASVFRSAIERVGLAFEVDCRPLPAAVLVDPGQLEQIMLNLLSNALKFTFSGSIGVTVRADGLNAILEVRDTGVGVPADDVPRLFERFHRVAGTRSRTHEGSGIGLALVKELVELQDGTIAVHSVPGEGTRFTVTFPFAMGTGPVPPPGPSREAEAFVAEALRWGGGDDLPSAAAVIDDANAANDGPHPVPAGTERPRVLVVDDNADMREYLARLLAGDYEVLTAADGRQGLERLRQAGADLVLSDVMMPVLDGAELLEEIRRDPVLVGTPVVLLSARAGEEASVEGLQAGADDYVVKPFTARELLARVAANLQLGAMRNAEAQRATEHAARLQRLLDREHRIAETLQRSLLPPALAEDPFTHVAGHYEPAQESVQVGGDFYDAIAVGDGRLLLVVGDVAGHGLGAAATMGQLRASVRSAALWDPEPGSLLEHLNEVVQRQEDRPLVTCQCLLLDADGTGATYAAAGHPPALALLPDGGVQLLADGSDPALGIVRGRHFHQTRIALAPQTTLLLYTDGLVERRDESIDAGIERLASRAAALRGLDPPELAARLVEAERSERPFADDVALLVATLTAPADHLHLDLPATADSLAGLRRVVLRWLAAHDIADADAYDLLLAAHEAAANAIEHAYNLLPGHCVADLRITGDVVEIRVRDTGAWRPPREENRGRGLTLMRGVMDEVELEHDGSGTVVRMSRRCQRTTSS